MIPIMIGLWIFGLGAAYVANEPKEPEKVEYCAYIEVANGTTVTVKPSQIDGKCLTIKGIK